MSMYPSLLVPPCENLNPLRIGRLRCCGHCYLPGGAALVFLGWMCDCCWWKWTEAPTGNEAGSVCRFFGCSPSESIAFLALQGEDWGPLPCFLLRRKRCELDAISCGLVVAAPLCLASSAGVLIIGSLSVQLLLLLCRFMVSGVASFDVLVIQRRCPG